MQDLNDFNREIEEEETLNQNDGLKNEKTQQQDDEIPKIMVTPPKEENQSQKTLMDELWDQYQENGQKLREKLFSFIYQDRDQGLNIVLAGYFKRIFFTLLT